MSQQMRCMLHQTVQAPLESSDTSSSSTSYGSDGFNPNYWGCLLCAMFGYPCESETLFNTSSSWDGGKVQHITQFITSAPNLQNVSQNGREMILSHPKWQACCFLLVDLMRHRIHQETTCRPFWKLSWLYRNTFQSLCLVGTLTSWFWTFKRFRFFSFSWQCHGINFYEFLCQESAGSSSSSSGLWIL